MISSLHHIPDQVWSVNCKGEKCGMGLEKGRRLLLSWSLFWSMNLLGGVKFRFRSGANFTKSHSLKARIPGIIQCKNNTELRKISVYFGNSVTRNWYDSDNVSPSSIYCNHFKRFWFVVFFWAVVLKTKWLKQPLLSRLLRRFSQHPPQIQGSVHWTNVPSFFVFQLPSLSSHVIPSLRTLLSQDW